MTINFFLVGVRMEASGDKQFDIFVIAFLCECRMHVSASFRRPEQQGCNFSGTVLRDKIEEQESLISLLNKTLSGKDSKIDRLERLIHLEGEKNQE